jgi:hypothetical protein
LAEILKKTPLLTMPEIEPMEIFLDDEEVEMITDVTEGEKPFLVKNNYLDEMNAKYIKVFLVQNPEICRLVFIVPRGNEEAELRFWKQMQLKGYLELLESAGVRRGDVLKVKSYYEGLEDRFVMYFTSAFS